MAGADRIPRITLRLMDRFEGRLSLPVYRLTLEQACEKSPPPFGTAEYGDVYREAAADPAWLAVSLVTNAEHEGDGAQRLWSLTACTEDPAVAALLKQHAIDESNHAKIYLRMLDLVFAGAIEPGFRVQLDGVSPGYTRAMKPVPQEGSPFAHPITLDDLIQMNIAEIRTTIHHLLQRPMLRAHCPPDRRDKLVQLQNRLLREELRHVAYTAKLIEEYSDTVGRHAVAKLFGERVLDFNEVTRAELEQRVFDVT